MVNVLLIGLFRLRRPGRRTPAAIRSLVAGAAGTLVIFAWIGVEPGAAIGSVRTIGQPLARAVINGTTHQLGNAAIQTPAVQLTFAIAFELCLPWAFFCLPPLLAARVARRWGSRGDRWNTPDATGLGTVLEA
jgi:hypothetical protein